MNNKFKLVLALALTTGLCGQYAQAEGFAFRIPASGVHSPDVVPGLGSFSVPTRPAGAAPFGLTPPVSNSPGAFTYTSSNPAVATVSGSTVTPLGVGRTTITATQAASPGYQAATTSAEFVVSAPSGYVSSGGLLWLIPTQTSTQRYWSDAQIFCTTGAFQGWRLPTAAEASSMALDIGASQLSAQGWNQSYTWTGTAVSSRDYNVFLLTGGIGNMQGSANKAYVSCVR